MPADRPTVIIPTHDGRARLGRALDSLRTQTIEHRVLVVDNGSSDGTAAMIEETFPEVGVLRLPRNLGFGTALNRAVRASSGSTVVFVNDDVVCERPFVERLCARLDPDRGVVMAAGVLLDWSAPGRIDTAGVVFDRTLFAFDYLHGEPVGVLDRPPPSPLGPTGGAAAFDRSAFLAVGGFDEHVFAYLEDVELAARLLARGKRCALAPDARALHRHSATLGSGSRRKNELMGWSRGYTMAKYRVHRRPRLLARALVGESALALGQLVIDRTWSGVPARVAGFRAGLRVPAQPLPRLPPEAARITASQVLRYRMRRRLRS